VGETLAAARGLGCTWNGHPARASSKTALAEATMVYSDSRHLEQRLGQRWTAVTP
jgi:hypothetical protein